LPLVVLAAVVPYLGCFRAPFVFDDFPAVVRNTSIRHLWPLGPVLHPPLDAAGATGRPLVNLSYALNYAAGGLDVWGYHAVNVALHACNALLVFLVLRRTFALPGLERFNRSAKPLAAAAAMVWAAHPLLSESVVCIAQRNELLVGFFTLLTFAAFLRSVSPGAPVRRWEGVAIASCFAGMLSKEVMAATPLLVLCYDRTLIAGSFRAAWRQRRILYVGLAASWLILLVLVLGHHQRNQTVGFGLGVSSWDYALTQCRALFVYLKLALWPSPLIVDYGTPVIHQLSAVWPQALAIVAALVVTAVAFAHRRPVGLLGAWFFVLLAPSSSFLPLTTQTIAEHRMYLPLLAVGVGAALLIHAALRDRVVWSCGALSLTLGFATWHRTAVYQSEVRLWTDTVAKVPRSPRAYASLGIAHVRAGAPERALQAYRRALELQPDYADAQSDYATALVQCGRRDEATAHYERAAALKPLDPDIRLNLGRHYRQIGRATDALGQIEAALRVRPDDVRALVEFGAALNQLGRYAEARMVLERAAAMDAADPAAQYELGFAQANLQQWSEAETHLRRASSLLPAAQRGPAYFALANALLESGRAADAIPVYRELLRRQPDAALPHHHLALALTITGDREAAIAEERRALELQPDLTEARENFKRLTGQ
jgi:tetratricopeptide (TPR) repeat protein